MTSLVDSNIAMVNAALLGIIESSESKSIHARDSASDGFLTNADLIGYPVGLFGGLLMLTVFCFLLERCMKKRKDRANRIGSGTQDIESGQRRTWWRRQRRQEEQPDPVTGSSEDVALDHVEPAVASLRRQRTAQRPWLDGLPMHADEDQACHLHQPQEQRKTIVSSSNEDTVPMSPQPALIRDTNLDSPLPAHMPDSYYTPDSRYQIQDLRY